MTKPVIILGAGGHARVLLSMLTMHNWPILGMVGPQPNLRSAWPVGIEHLGDDDVLMQHDPLHVELVNALGSLPRQMRRAEIFKQWQAKGFHFPNLIHQHAFVADEATLSTGCQIMAGAVIQCGVTMHDNVIVNTGACIDHDCQIGAHTHVAPGAVLSGGVRVGKQVHIGTGATVIQNVELGDGVIVGAGAVVTKNCLPNTIVYPARSTSSSQKRELP